MQKKSANQMIDGSFCIMSLKDKSCVGLIISNLQQIYDIARCLDQVRDTC